MSGSLTVSPEKAVAFVQATFASGKVSYGSAVLVGRNDLLTATEVVYDIETRQVAQNVKLYFDYTGSLQSSPFISTSFARYFQGLDSNGDGNVGRGDGRAGSLAEAERGVTVLALTTPVGDTRGWLSLDTVFTGGSATLRGYGAPNASSMEVKTGQAVPDRVDSVMDLGMTGGVGKGFLGSPILSGPNARKVVGIVSGADLGTTLGAHLPWMQVDVVVNDAYLTTGTDVFRFFNTRTGAHFFTPFMEEAFQVALTLNEFKFEGMVFGSRATEQNGIVVHRLWDNNTSKHFYTGFEQEYAFLKTQSGWRDEGVGFMAYAEDGADRLDVFRFFNTKTGVHLYTTSEVERDQVFTLSEYRYEGVAFYLDTVW